MCVLPDFEKFSKDYTNAFKQQSGNDCDGNDSDDSLDLDFSLRLALQTAETEELNSPTPIHQTKSSLLRAEYNKPEAVMSRKVQAGQSSWGKSTTENRARKIGEGLGMRYVASPCK